MAKYTITHCCGHEETVNLVGPNKERERRIEWLESMPCVECRAKADDDLEGSTKQIAWAADIRKGAISGLSDEDVAILMEIKSASWWIDNRNRTGKDLVDEIKAKRDVEERIANVDDSDLVELTGYKEDIEEATAIRKTMIAVVERKADLSMGDNPTDEVKARRDEAMERFFDWINTKTRARWFALNFKGNSRYDVWYILNKADSDLAKAAKED